MVWQMKKNICLWISLFCIVCVQLFVPPVQAEDAGDEPKELYAQSAVLIDADSGRILFGKEEKKVRPMASTTKIMTCIITLEQMEEGQAAQVSDYAVCQPKVRLGVRGKEEYYIGDLLYSLMLESHNDSAVVIAEGIAGSVEAFADLMNEKAQELGCKDTHFITPNGLDDEDEKGVHSTTAADLARIMKYCITESPKKEEFLKITRTKEYSFTNIKGDRRFSCRNHNAFLDMMEGALTGKTGFTADAGYCYVGALRQGERTFIVALLGCGWPNNKGYKWKDTRKLMEYGLKQYEYRDVWKKFRQEGIPVRGGIDKGNAYKKDGYVMAGLKGDTKELKLLLRKDEEVKVRAEVDKELKAPVQKGQKVGAVSYLLNGEVIRSYDVVALETVKERDLAWCFQEALQQICL